MLQEEGKKKDKSRSKNFFVFKGGGTLDVKRKKEKGREEVERLFCERPQILAF